MVNAPRVCFDLNHLHKVLLGEERHTGISRVIFEMAREVSLCNDSRQLELVFGLSLYPQLTKVVKAYAFSKGCDLSFIEPRGVKAWLYDMIVKYELPSYKGSLIGKATPSLYKRSDKIDVYHSPFSAIRTPTKAGSVLATTVYDIIPFTHPKFVNPERMENSQKNLRTVAKNSDFFFLISEFARGEWCDYFNIPESRTMVVPLAASKEVFFPELSVDKIQAVRERYEIPEGRYILTLANLEPRKNIAGVLQAFFTLLNENQLDDVNLVIAGKKGHLLDQVLAPYQIESRHRDRVIFTGGVDDSDMSAIYSGAEFFTFLSYCEGFGLPPLEAMQCGVPVVCANTTSLPEVCQGAALMVNPDDQDQICQSFLDVLDDENLRAELSERGLRRSREFSWKSSAELTLETYRMLAS